MKMDKKNILSFGIAGVIGLLILTYVIGNVETKALTDDSRAVLPGQFIELSQGYVNFDTQGPQNGQPVLLIPGISLPRVVWQQTAGALAEAGYWVIDYDIFGRGFSDRPNVDYGPDLYNRQIHDLLTAFNITAPVHVVGLAYGGLLAVKYSEANPESVASLTLIAPDGLGTEIPLYARMLKIPGIGKLLGAYIFGAFGERLLDKRLQRYTDAGASMEAIIGGLKASMQFKGFMRALVSSIIYTPLETAEEAFQTVDKQGTKTLIIWGKNDPITPLSISEKITAAMPHAQLQVFDAGHLPHHETPDTVNQAIVAFLASTRNSEKTE